MTKQQGTETPWAIHIFPFNFPLFGCYHKLHPIFVQTSPPFTGPQPRAAAKVLVWREMEGDFDGHWNGRMLSTPAHHLQASSGLWEWTCWRKPEPPLKVTGYESLVQSNSDVLTLTGRDLYSHKWNKLVSHSKYQPAGTIPARGISASTPTQRPHVEE